MGSAEFSIGVSVDGERIHLTNNKKAGFLSRSFFGTLLPPKSGNYTLHARRDNDGGFAVMDDDGRSSEPRFVITSLKLDSIADCFTPCSEILEHTGPLKHLVGKRFSLEFTPIERKPTVAEVIDEFEKEKLRTRTRETICEVARNWEATGQPLGNLPYLAELALELKAKIEAAEKA